MKAEADKIPERSWRKKPLQEDEYVNDGDGLIYCARCRTPRQHPIQLNDTTIFVSALCRCQQEEFAQREEARKRYDEFMRLSRLKASGLQDKLLRNFSFSNDRGFNQKIQKARAYVDNWTTMQKDSVGLLLWGNVGTGKTFMAGCIANALLNQGVSVLMTNVPRILNTLAGMYPNERNEFINSFNTYSLLIIDDLGAERESDFAYEQLFSIVDSRYRSGKPLIVTTNLTLAELKTPKDLAHARIFSRILERCVPVGTGDFDIRAIGAADNMKKLKEITASDPGQRSVRDAEP